MTRAADSDPDLPMTRLLPLPLPLLRVLSFLCLGTLLTAATVRAGDVPIRLQLVWGTDGELPEGKQFSRLEPDLQRKFLRHLRWKNYFVVKSETRAVKGPENQSVALSKRCTVEVAVVGEDQLQVRIHGVDAEGKPRLVDSKMQSIAKLREGHVFVYGGDSRDNWDDAWLVVITAEP